MCVDAVLNILAPEEEKKPSVQKNYNEFYCYIYINRYTVVNTCQVIVCVN